MIGSKDKLRCLNGNDKISYMSMANSPAGRTHFAHSALLGPSKTARLSVGQSVGRSVCGSVSRLIDGELDGL